MVSIIDSKQREQLKNNITMIGWALAKHGESPVLSELLPAFVASIRNAEPLHKFANEEVADIVAGLTQRMWQTITNGVHLQSIFADPFQFSLSRQMRNEP
jgi:hypothetical protein